MPNFTMGYPRKTGDTKKDVECLHEWATALTDELKYILANLDECNLAEHIIENERKEQ